MGPLGSYLFGALVLLVFVIGNMNVEGADLMKDAPGNIVPFILFLIPAVMLMAGYVLPIQPETALKRTERKGQTNPEKKCS